MRTRLPHEPFVYEGVGRSNDQWPDHRLRVLVSGSMLAWMHPQSVLDPACGDGGVVRCADTLLGNSIDGGIPYAKLTDAGAPNIDAVYPWLPAGWDRGVLDVYESVMTAVHFDAIVLTEILEHLEDPDALLRVAADKTDQLLVSSPEMRPGQVDTNPEHLWMFDGQGYEQMLVEAGWGAVQKTHLTFRSEYDFGIYVCEKLP